jgi:hypothetical protein
MTYATDGELTERALRHRIDSAEANLLRDRLALENHYAFMGLPTAAMFARSIFVRRSTADRWLAEQQREFDARLAEAKKAADEDPDEEPGDEGDDSPHAPPEDDAAKKKRKAADKKRREAEDDDDEPAGDDDETGKMARFLQPRDSGADARDAATARAIIAAAAKARGESAPRPSGERQGNSPPRLTVVPGAPLPPKGTVARAIIDAGKRRRGEEVD